MTDHTANSGHASHRYPARTPRAEFVTYFALIFVAALPIVSVMWLWTLVTSQRLPVEGPIARAWREAGLVTPMLFRP
jgi:hypothetical protein